MHFLPPCRNEHERRRAAKHHRIINAAHRSAHRTVLVRARRRLLQVSRIANHVFSVMRNSLLAAGGGNGGAVCARGGKRGAAAGNVEVLEMAAP